MRIERSFVGFIRRLLGICGRYKRVFSFVVCTFSFVYACVFCSNYSSTKQTVNPPVILGISAQEGGHVVQVSAYNVEVGFSGYRLFQGLSEDAVRNADPISGIDCTLPLAVLPNQAITYYIEVIPGKTAPEATGDRLCVVPLALTSGTFISFRSLIFADITSVETGISSNAFLVP